MKSEVIAVRMDPAAAARLKIRARGEGMSTGAYLRLLLDQAEEREAIAALVERQGRETLEAVENLARRVIDATARVLAQD